MYFSLGFLITPRQFLIPFTPYSMNSLFDEFFREFSRAILGVCETIWGLFGGNFEGNLKENYSTNCKQLLIITKVVKINIMWDLTLVTPLLIMIKLN